MSNIPVKVVIINTQYIETDANSFKSIVQKLTGKNSTVAVESAFAPPPPLLSPVAASYDECGHGSNNYWEDQNVAASLGRLKSFNEFDKLFKELPTLDDLLRLYSDEIQQ
ncbi:hypothetical protein EJD97_025220 [Solanum chilense]|uniref:VQ domain-containing protein n=1 Tax=Solanum chilense TaxID=4083 RepID=A0A6N2C0F6_SOLCI|nr:hypothetical protein EJD97_025220 [Solanum chilense]